MFLSRRATASRAWHSLHTLLISSPLYACALRHRWLSLLTLSSLAFILLTPVPNYTMSDAHAHTHVSVKHGEEHIPSCAQGGMTPSLWRWMSHSYLFLITTVLLLALLLSAPISRASHSLSMATGYILGVVLLLTSASSQVSRVCPTCVTYVTDPATFFTSFVSPPGVHATNYSMAYTDLMNSKSASMRGEFASHPAWLLELTHDTSRQRIPNHDHERDDESWTGYAKQSVSVVWTMSIVTFMALSIYETGSGNKKDTAKKASRPGATDDADDDDDDDARAYHFPLFQSTTSRRGQLQPHMIQVENVAISVSVCVCVSVCACVCVWTCSLVMRACHVACHVLRVMYVACLHVMIQGMMPNTDSDTDDVAINVSPSAASTASHELDDAMHVMRDDILRLQHMLAERDATIVRMKTEMEERVSHAPTHVIHVAPAAFEHGLSSIPPETATATSTAISTSMTPLIDLSTHADMSQRMTELTSLNAELTRLHADDASVIESLQQSIEATQQQAQQQEQQQQQQLMSRWMRV